MGVVTLTSPSTTSACRVTTAVGWLVGVSEGTELGDTTVDGVTVGAVKEGATVGTVVLPSSCAVTGNVVANKKRSATHVTVSTEERRQGDGSPRKD